MKKTNKKGFTLVELVIVIAVLAILAAIAIPAVTSIVSNANKSAAASNAHQVQAAVNAYIAKIDAGLITEPTGGATLTAALKDYGTSTSAMKPRGGWTLYFNTGDNTVTAVKDGKDPDGNNVTTTGMQALSASSTITLNTATSTGTGTGTGTTSGTSSNG